MLFRREDFAAPDSSALYHDLRHSPDEQVRDLSYYLFQLVGYRLHDIPPIDEVLLWCNSLDELLEQRDWDKALQLAARMGEGFLSQVVAFLAITLATINVVGGYTVTALVTGGGVTGQTGAVVQGIARALVAFDPDLRGVLRRGGYLTRDPREKERKKPGLKRARKAPQYTKR